MLPKERVEELASRKDKVDALSCVLRAGMTAPSEVVNRDRDLQRALFSLSREEVLTFLSSLNPVPFAFFSRSHSACSNTPMMFAFALLLLLGSLLLLV